MSRTVDAEATKLAHGRHMNGVMRLQHLFGFRPDDAIRLATEKRLHPAGHRSLNRKRAKAQRSARRRNRK